MSDLGFTKETTPGEPVREFYRRQGAIRATEAIIEFLYKSDALRDSFFGGDEWAVLYTEDGALDVRLSDIRAAGLKVEKQ